MSEQIIESIKELLQRKEVQERIQQHIQDNRSQVKVPIGGAVNLSGFSENQLRKWEEKGLLSPQREGKHRYYTIQDLDKLAVIRELIEAKFSPGIIPTDIYNIWRTISGLDDQTETLQEQEVLDQDTFGIENMYINQRIESAREELFWRYYASHALKIILHLIRENIPSTVSTTLGIVLPFHVDKTTFEAIQTLDDLAQVGESLVGWLAISGSSHTLLTTVPAFEYPSQYRMYHLQTIQEGIYEERDGEIDCTLLITAWKFSNLTLPHTTVKVIRRLLAPLYNNIQKLQTCFGLGMRDLLDPATNLASDYADYILDGLAEIAIHLENISSQQKWRFCCILLPNDSTLPLQQRSLVVRAQSPEAPHKLGKILVSPNDIAISTSLRAYQSGQVIYRPEIYKEDITIALREIENPGSTIAIPIDGSNDTPSGILYLVANESHAFNIDDQRVLRLMCKMIQELLTTYQLRLQAVERMTDAIEYPEVINTFFELKGILSENNFRQDIESFLKDIQIRMQERQEEPFQSKVLPLEENSKNQVEISSGEVLTLIYINIDQKMSLVNRYGDQFLQNISKVVGSYLQIQLPRIFTEQVEYTLYHTCAGRFYLLLDQLPLEDACKHAERIRRRLDEEYEVSVLRSVNESIVNPRTESVQLVHVTVHVAVSSYTYKKIENLLQRYSAATAVGNVRALIDRDIDRGLNRGRIEGGNVVIFWNPDPSERDFMRWIPNA